MMKIILIVAALIIGAAIIVGALVLKELGHFIDEME